MHWLRIVVGVAALLTLCDGEATREEQQQFTAVRNLFRVGPDPDALVDTFAELGPNVQRIWDGPRVSFEELRRALRSTEMDVSIDVVLVGFDGDGAAQLSVEQSTLASYLRTVHASFAVHALGFPDQGVPSNEEIRVNVHYNVVAQRKRILKEIEDKISTSLGSFSARIHISTPDYEVMTIPYEGVDAIIRGEFSQSRLLPTIYVINPAVQAALPYAYRYDKEGSVGCPGNFWTSTEGSPGVNYIWIDISAGPLKYGPQQVGSGQVMEHSFPRVGSFPAKLLNKGIVPDVTAMIHSATQHLLVPQSLSLSLPPWRRLVIQIIHIHDAVVPGKDAVHSADTAELTTQLSKLTLKGQSIEIRDAYLTFGRCSSCTAAYTQALLTGIGRVAGKNSVIEESEFLDAFILHDWLGSTSLQSSLQDNRNIRIDLRSQMPDEWILPVFILEIAGMKVLAFEDGKQAVSFSDMVVAVRTHSGTFQSDMSCAGQAIAVSSANTTRPLLAAILQTVWGVVETGEVWSPARGKIQDYRWSIGATPFGHMSSLQTLPHALQRTAKRNVILACASQLMQETLSVFDLMEKLTSHGHPSEALDKEALALFYRRSHVFRAKMAVGLLHTGRAEFEMGLYYIESGKHEIKALQKLVADLRTSGPQPVLVCSLKRGRMQFWICGAAGVGVALVLWILRMMRPVKPKAL